jgi:two-component system chemotaxis response regulator CheB
MSGVAMLPAAAPRRNVAAVAEKDFPVIALVGSAGGLDAISRVLSGLPENFAASMLVVIHQAPDRANALVDLLARRCPLPVTVAENDGALEARRVLVVPPGTHLLITPNGRASLIASGASPPSRPSADLLLATMATSLGGRAAAVVLSGHGHDGATGATAIHKLGGVVLASDEASSREFAMPEATIDREHVIDRVASVDDIAPILTALVDAYDGTSGGGLGELFRDRRGFSEPQ